MEEDELLTSIEALKRIVFELNRIHDKYQSSNLLRKEFVDAFSLSSTLPWPYVLMTLIAVAALFVTSIRFGNAQFCALFLLSVLALNTFLSMWENRKKRKEVTLRIKWCIDNLKDVYDDSSFPDCLRLDEFSSLLNNCDTAAISNSPSHSISYVYRRNAEKNDISVPMPIPTSLLTTGDFLSLWPGEESPAKIECAQDQCLVLDVGEVFQVSHLHKCGFSLNDEDNPKNHRFEVMESPVVAEIEEIVKTLYSKSSTSKCKPPILFERQRRYFLHLFFKIVIPVILVIAYIVSVIRLVILPQPSTFEKLTSNVTNIITNINMTITIQNADYDDRSWYTMLIEIPILLCIPLLPLLLPGLLVILIAIGEAKTLSVCHKNKHIMPEQFFTTPTAMSSQAVFFKTEALREISWQELLPKLLFGEDGSVFHRNAGLFTLLGSLTVLCCVDKEGVLSWFNPIAEKVFFFKHEVLGETKNKNQEEDESVFRESPEGNNMLPVLIENEEEDMNGSLFDKNGMTSPSSEEQKILTETLTLSQDSRDPSHIQFDDVRWEDHLSSLKPIGLNIVLSLCCCPFDRSNFQWTGSDSSFQAEIMEKLNQKSSSLGGRNKNEENTSPHLRMHEKELSTIAYNADSLIPNTRIAMKGLCSLAELVGFAQDIRLAYNCKQSFSAFRRPLCLSLQHHLAKLDLSITHQESADLTLVGNLESIAKRNKWKQYLPHMYGIVLQDAFGDEQALVYGTGDLITEQCRHIWDGSEIRTISVLDRRKAVDFYQRSSAIGQCIAFAFMPIISENGETAETNVDIDETLLVNLSKNKEKKKSIQVGTHRTEILNNMIFLGMTALQHQARFTVCQMVDMLDRACIRFVYFSADNEVRSRIFAEKMGLETGWNCHISLADTPSNTMGQEGRLTSPVQNRSESSSKSRTSSENGPAKQKQTLDDDEEDSPSSHLLDRMSPRTQSESSTSDSIFNVSNRAKLPRGIKNIVPHIENVDNVPLLVPLFTDATPETAGEMVEIMQDYGEVVCCIGSSDCIRNMSVFHQAHVSLAIEPLVHPMKRSKSSLSSLDNSSINSESDQFIPEDSQQQSSVTNCVAMKTARKLHCFPCSLLLSGDDSLNVISTMITQARHFLFLLRIFFIFLMKCQVALSLFLLFSHIMLLPPPLLPMDVFWIAFIISPCLSLSLLGSPPDPDLMTWANQKTLPKDSPVTKFMFRQSTKRFLVKFLPSILMLIMCYTLSLHSCCLSVRDIMLPRDRIQVLNSTKSNVSLITQRYPFVEVQCFPYFLITLSNYSTGNSTKLQILLWDSTKEMQQKKRALQLTTMCFFVLYLCIVSTAYVHRWKRLTHTPPYLNKLWFITVPVLLICQFVGSLIAYFIFESSSYGFHHPDLNDFSSKWFSLDFGQFQSAIWALLAVWPVLCIGFNELWKSREIKMWNRGQKRARLDFGTKLGMNSPF